MFPKRFGATSILTKNIADSEVLNEVYACDVPQKVWRHKWRFGLTRKLLKTLVVNYGINPSTCSEASLEVLLAKFRNEKIKTQTGRVVRRLILGYAEKSRRDGLLKLFDNKIYLSLVLISNKHEQILESLRAMREKKLFAASNTMLDSFQRIVYGLEKSLSLKKGLTEAEAAAGRNKGFA
jgi:hypothetical protein